MPGIASNFLLLFLRWTPTKFVEIEVLPLFDTFIYLFIYLFITDPTISFNITNLEFIFHRGINSGVPFSAYLTNAGLSGIPIGMPPTVNYRLVRMHLVLKTLILRHCPIVWRSNVCSLN